MKSIRLSFVCVRTQSSWLGQSLHTQLNVATRTSEGALPSRCRYCSYSSRRQTSSLSNNTSSESRKPPKPKTDKPEKIKIKPEPPKSSTYDLIGPPDVTSNIPAMKFHVPPNETEVEREYREKRVKVLQWTHDYWAEHNSSFFKLKEEFSAKKLKEKSEGGDQNEPPMLSAEEMSQFYKKFLDDNYRAHVQFNKEWYKKNISLLWPAFKVFWTRQLKRLKN